MKKTLIGILIVLVLSVSAWAVINPPVSTALNTSTYVAITLPKIWGCRDLVVYTDDGSEFLVSSVAAGTDGVTIPAGSSISLDCVSDTNGVVLYAKASSGTPNLICIYGSKK